MTPFINQQKPVTMYTKTPCPFCVAAKRFFETRNIRYTEIDLTEDPDRLLEIKRQTGWMTVPIIFIGEELIGGYMDLKKLEEEGRLQQKLY
ncbi:MAG: glutaredoxin [Bdellovibrionaceae bacterium]|nr:glutaredoxin [Pseudobdellovibrionaceae bacterium]MDW8190819.1 glutaredoxin [Pseudobdellovibrionaceae bacterium]